MEDDGRHIGLRNIYQRIKLLYDMENGVEIGSDNENGFQVLVGFLMKKKNGKIVIKIVAFFHKPGM